MEDITEKPLQTEMYPIVSYRSITDIEQRNSPSLEVHDAKAVRGIKAHSTIPHHTAQHWVQHRGDAVQCRLRGHVVHLSHPSSLETAKERQKKGMTSLKQ